MKEQNYQNHKRYDFFYHVVSFSLAVLLLISSIYSLYASIKGHYDLRYSIMFFIISILIFVLFFYLRVFSLKAQDRAIRAEENLRHFVLAGKLLDKNLNIQQILALRFAPDEEFISLAEKAVKNNLSNDDIKKEIKNWKADNYRV